MCMKKICLLLFVIVLICGFFFLAGNKSKPVSADMEDDSTASKIQMQATDVSDLEPDFVVPFFDELKGEFACNLGTQIEYFSSENSFSHDPLKVFSPK